MSKIEWTEKTWNPIAGCTVVSPGCTHCYAMREAHRHAGNPNPKVSGKYRGLTTTVKGKPVWTGKVRLWEDHLTLPLTWRKPRRIFVNSMSDLFHEDVPDEWIDQIFGVMTLAPQHQFQVLTKRPERMREYFAPVHDDGLNGLGARWCWATAALIGGDPGAAPGFPLPNVWLGTSVEDQTRADERIPHLLATPAAVRFLSVEPLLGPVDLTDIDIRRCGPSQGDKTIDALRGVHNRFGEESPTDGALDWVIVGGESGPGARPMQTSWARRIRDQCHHAGVPFFMKQMNKIDPIPDDLMIREWPMFKTVVPNKGGMEK